MTEHALQNAAAEPGASAIDWKELDRRRRRVRVFDVRAREAYRNAHIAGAESLPIAEVERISELVPDRDAEIVVYCARTTCPLAGQAADKLARLGYANVRHFHGGIAEWQERGLPVESEQAFELGPPAAGGARDGHAAHANGAADVTHPATRARRARRPLGTVIVDEIERLSTSQVFLLWLAMVLSCGIAYWLLGFVTGHGLVAGGVPVGSDLGGFGTAIYFSFVTATSVGYGDVAPLGLVRALAGAEAVTGLLIFGAVVAKFVSRRQDELVREIHRITFEERLDRVQASLHLVLGELQSLADLCADASRPAERIRSRLESAALVFASELRATHDLLYRPQWAPEEVVLKAILTTLAAALHELLVLLDCLPARIGRSPALDNTLSTVAALAQDICGECVPFRYAPSLREWMDRIHEAASGIARP